MKGNCAIVMIGVVLWTLGVLFGGSVSELLPSSSSVLSPVVVLIVALLAAVANLVVLYYKVQSLGSGKA